MSLARSAERTARGPAVEALARLGYAAKGVVYLIIGLLAARVAWGDGGVITDRKGALQAIYQQPLGRFLLGAVVVGLIGYALWCIVLRGFLDAENKGGDAKGVLSRVAYVVVGISYGSLALAAFNLLTGSGGGTGKSSDASTQDWTARLLRQSYGEPLIILAGAIVIGVALYRCRVAYKASFMRNFEYLGQHTRQLVRNLGRLGIAAQAMVFLIMGGFLIAAAWNHNAREAKGIGGSLQQLVREPYGHLLLGLVAVGLVAFGCYGLLQARFRRIATAV
jgi:hypothetical protein